jgi:hypothetical protein
MLRFYVDFNAREGDDTVILNPGGLNIGVSEDRLREGDTVVLYAEDMECQARLRRGLKNRWVADIDGATVKHLPPEQWNRFRKEN